MNQNLQTAHWVHTNDKAQLIADDKMIIEIEFGKKTATAKCGKQEYEISTEGFWCPRIVIRQQETIVALQKQVGIWGTKSEFVIDNQTYTAKTKQGELFNITYSANTADILTYKLDASKNSLQITFEIKQNEVPGQHLLLLLALGFYSIKNVALEALGNDFLVLTAA